MRGDTSDGCAWEVQRQRLRNHLSHMSLPRAENPVRRNHSRSANLTEGIFHDRDARQSVAFRQVSSQQDNLPPIPEQPLPVATAGAGHALRRSCVRQLRQSARQVNSRPGPTLTQVPLLRCATLLAVTPANLVKLPPTTMSPLTGLNSVAREARRRRR